MVLMIEKKNEQISVFFWLKNISHPLKNKH